MDLNKYPKIKKAYEIYSKMSNDFYKIAKVYDKNFKNNCLDCDIFDNNYKGRAFKDCYLKCNGCKHEKKMRELALEYDRINHELDEFEEKVFAKEIYDEFIKTDPYVFNKRDKQFYKFSEVFTEEFLKKSPKQYIQLTGLITEDGGLYRFKLK